MKFKGTWKYQDKAEAKEVQKTLEFNWGLSCTVKGVYLTVEGDYYPEKLRDYLNVRAVEISFVKEKEKC